MFTWDVAKAITNYFKHGIPFEYATSVFSDDTALEVEDVKHSQKELRRIRVGEADDKKILTVVFTVRRLSNGKETIRIISARQASRKEREALTRFRNRL
jgi:uncharacterized DUF497 family protein